MKKRKKVWRREKEADEGEKEEWLKKRKKEEVFKLYKGNTSLA